MLPRAITPLILLLTIGSGHARPDEQDDEFLDESLHLTKREVTMDGMYTHTQLTSDDSALGLTLVEHTHGRRLRRSAFDTNPKWDHHIPYILDQTFLDKGEYVISALKRAFRYVMENVCVTYTDETDNWDSSNAYWFTQNSYTSDAFILIHANSTGCSAKKGPQNQTGINRMKPCFGFDINVHEILHTLGAVHTQQIPIRDRYITINDDNINPEMLKNYNSTIVTEAPSPYNKYFDALSELLYSRGTWHSNGLETWTPIRDDIFNPYVDYSMEEVTFSELSQIFQCNSAQFCPDPDTDCGPGYYTKVKGTCRCVCPQEYDPATNCSSLVNGPTSPSLVSWPDTPFVLWAAGPDHSCPTGFDQTPGWLSHEGIWVDIQKPVPVYFPTEGKVTYIPICTKSTPTSNIDWESWPPGGKYCILKPQGEQCGGAFYEATAIVKSEGPVTYNGSIGDTVVNSTTDFITTKFCCRASEDSDMSIDLPNDKPFRMFAKGQCTNVRGVRGYKAKFTFYAHNKSMDGEVKPQYYIFSKELQLFQCYYQPPTYGCNQEITLDATTPSATVTTPGYGVARQPDRRCFYSFNVPAGAQVRITFNTWDNEPDDLFLVKRYHKWQEPVRLPHDELPRQLISEESYLLLEYWSGWTAVANLGVNFTADVVLAENSCYNTTVRGADYLGDTSVSETYEPCLPWAEARLCADYPGDGIDELLGVTSGAACRNPEGNLTQPWCYTYRNGTNCHKRYCDVCNIAAPTDVLTSCSALVAADANFCTSGIQRHACSLTCGFSQVSYTAATCNAPTIPAGGELVETPAQSEYREGDRVHFKCSSNSALPELVSVCTQSGWTNIDNVCDWLTDCPEGWTLYGDRCFFFEIFTKRTYAAALADCEDRGPGGTLFRIRSEADQLWVRQFKLDHYHINNWYVSHNWLSAERNSTGHWHYSGTTTPLPYTNWTASFTNSHWYPCAYMIQDVSTNPNKGGWKSKKCDNGATYRYTCQIDPTSTTRPDKVSSCQDTLVKYPDFCTNSRTKDVAFTYCQMTCGYYGAPSGCSEPTSGTYTKVSPANSTINTGETFTFACNAGLYHTGGDLQRACVDGTLLGVEPTCQALNSVDIMTNSLRTRLDTLPKKRAYILDNDYYRIPFNGSITKWDYFCQNPGTVYLLVYRQDGSLYTKIGNNSIDCESGYKWEHSVPTADQISALEGDVVGLYTEEDDTLFATTCDGEDDELMPGPSTSAGTFSQLEGVSAFTDTRCIIPSLAYRVEAP